MRQALYALLLTTILVAVAATPAFAQADAGPADKTAREERRAALLEARNESFQMFRENRTAAFQEYHAAFNATKASYLENKTRVKAECEALRNETATGADNATQHCVRDGLKPLREAAHAEHKAQKAQLRERLEQAREDAKAHFRAAFAKPAGRSSG